LDKRQQIEALAQSDEDKILLARVYDRILGAEQKNIPAATCFLTEREQVLAERLLRGTEPRFFGGREGAERAVCCYIPDYLDADEWLHGDDGPVCALRAEFSERESLTHRDFLGSLMGSGIKRETVGDILVGEGSCDLLVTREISPYVLDNLISAGRVKLSVREIALDELAAPEEKFRELRDTVATTRLDSIVSSGFGLARAKAAALVESGKVSVNALPCVKPDRLLTEGDRVTARGLGRLELAAVGGTTKKGRTGVVIRRFA